MPFRVWISVCLQNCKEQQLKCTALVASILNAYFGCPLDARRCGLRSTSVLNMKFSARP